MARKSARRNTKTSKPVQQQAPDTRKSGLSAALIGAGLMAAVDEIVFHQILAWHHFYDRSTPAIGLLSDGLLHAAEIIALIAGAFLLWELRERGRLSWRAAKAGLFVGAGAFQVFDGIVNHKILRLHQIRDVEPIWPYDLAWNLFGLALIGIGLMIRRRGTAEDTVG